MSSTTVDRRIDLPEAVRLTNLAMNACNLSVWLMSSRGSWRLRGTMSTRAAAPIRPTTTHSRCSRLVKMAELAGLCVEAPDAGNRTEDGFFSGGAIHHAFNWLREQSR